MGLRGLLESPHLVILTLAVVVLFGWKRLPDVARGLGRSMRIFKSEVEQMKSEGKATSSAASGDTMDHPCADRSADTDPESARDSRQTKVA